MLIKIKRRIRQGGKIIAKGELADGYGTWYVREIKRPLGGILQCLGLGAVRCNRRTFVKFEIPPGASSTARLAALFQSQPKSDHQLEAENVPKESRFHKRFRHPLAEFGTRLAVYPIRQLAIWILPRLALIRASARTILGKPSKSVERK